MAASLLAGLTVQLLLGTSYVAAFLDPVQEGDGIPVALVNLDQGPLGARFIEGILKQDVPVTWMHPATRAEALRGLEEKALYGALVIPANFTEALQSAATLSPRPATVELLGNPGASTSGHLIASRVLEAAMDALRAEVQERALHAAQPAPALAPGTGAFTLEQARFLADPVKVTETTVNPVAPRTANGLAPTYLTMAAWVGGYFGALALDRFRDRTGLSSGLRALIVPAASLAQGLVATGVLLVIGYAPPEALMLATVLAVGTWMAYAVVSLLADLLGTAGAIPAFALMAVGIPASGAVYPVELLPPLFQALSAWNPFTWLVEALRTTLHTPGAPDLAGHLARLALLALAASGLSLAWARLRRRAAAPPAT